MIGVSYMFSMMVSRLPSRPENTSTVLPVAMATTFPVGERAISDGFAEDAEYLAVIRQLGDCPCS